jgi:hypothetical protein
MTTNEESCTYAAHSGTVWEKIGSQIVMASLDTGKYCSIDEGSGTLIWEMLMSGHSIKTLHGHLKNYYGDYGSAQANVVDLLIQQLIDMAFIVPFTHSTPCSQQVAPPSGQAFPTPVLRIYDDIDSILQLDPIDDDLDAFLNTT